jgi:hypothetical protein
MFDKITIHTISPHGWPVDFELTPNEKGALEEALNKLEKWGYSPTSDANRDIQWTPDGLPICPKHGVVMHKREKQGDVWYSHTVTDENGAGHYCRGYACKSGPGWNIDQR